MIITSEVAITGPESYHAELMRAVDESGCYMDLSDYVRSRIRTFVRIAELVFTPLKDREYASTGPEMFLSHYMKKLKADTKKRFYGFEGPKKTVYVSIPQPLY